jgi:hypothetical protein
MNQGIEPSGIERAAEQGIAGFEAQQFPDPAPAMPPTPIGPQIRPEIPGISPNGLFTRPHFMEGGWPVASDRMSWWNGVMWVPGRPPGPSNANQASTPGTPIYPSPAAPLALFLVALAIMAVLAYIGWSALQSMPTLGPGPPLP